jgi:methylated-DNA-protein-cysteine methyltransferase related protein
MSKPSRLPPRDWRTAIRRAVARIPRGKVATYGDVAAAAGCPRHHRQVVQVLREAGDSLPWHRVVGAGGVIRLAGSAGAEQRLRLQMDGVRFRGRNVALREHRCTFRPLQA